MPNVIPICNLGRLKLLNSTFDLNVEFNSVEFNKLSIERQDLSITKPYKVCKKFGFYFVIMYCYFCLYTTVKTGNLGNFKVLFLAVSNRFKPNINI